MAVLTIIASSFAGLIGLIKEFKLISLTFVGGIVFLLLSQIPDLHKYGKQGFQIAGFILMFLAFIGIIKEVVLDYLGFYELKKKVDGLQGRVDTNTQDISIIINSSPKDQQDTINSTRTNFMASTSIVKNN